MRIELHPLKYFMKSVFVALFFLSGLVTQSKSYLKIELDNANHIVIFDGSLYTVNGKFGGEIDGGKHAISILKHNYNLTNSKVKTDVIYEGTLDLTDNMFYVYKLSSGYLSFVSVDVYSPIISTVIASNSQETSSTNNNTALVTGTAMDEATFATFLTKMKDKSMDSQKLDFAKSTMKNNWFNTDQVLQMLQTLSMENNKVELSKLIWHKTTDKSSFFKIYGAFTFSSSEKSVQDYVDSQN